MSATIASGPDVARPVGRDLLPTSTPLRMLQPSGAVADDAPAGLPTDDVLIDLHRRMVLGRRFDSQATALTKQGRLAVYPSARGQEACEIGAVAALDARDWLFPTYRDAMAIVARGVDPVDALSLLRGDQHCGYDPYQHHVGTQCTPLATNTLHAVGFAHAARLKGDDTVTLVLLGDGATSEGDTHEALNFAAVWQAPVVFLVQNNGFAISVPISDQSAAPSLAHKGVGYGIPSHLIDGNDAAIVYAVVRSAVEAARRGEGPTLIEALTYRVEAHTNADDASRYRSEDEVRHWRAQDPIDRLDAYLTSRGLLDDNARAAIAADGERAASTLRYRMNAEPRLDPQQLFEHVYARPTAALVAQRAELAEETALADEAALADQAEPAGKVAP